jgi:hypothetical protein
MAQDTPKNFNNLVIYEIYVRNHGNHGTFADVEADLERIQSMGVDVVWFMPIHPIGLINKKGSIGCPYSISNYREVNPEYGTKDDFSKLIEKAHALGMKVMIDVVYNHTAHDSDLVYDHPDWFHQDENGRPITTVPEWSDVIDLKHPNPALSEYLIETLQQWAIFGVDGFRCDVASLLPQDFWIAARKAVEQVKPGVIWLAESVHASWVASRRAHNLSGISDSELYAAFDLTYDYDIWPLWKRTVEGKIPVDRYLEILRFQDSIFPVHYIKMRCVENHDQSRIMASAPSRNQAIAWTAFQAFNKGAFLLYAGQESAENHTPSLFDIDKVNWRDYPLQPLITKLAHLKKHPALLNGQFILLNGLSTIQTVWHLPGNSLFGIFNIQGETGFSSVLLHDGTYLDFLSNEIVYVIDGKINLPITAYILEHAIPTTLKPAFSPLLD